MQLGPPYVGSAEMRNELAGIPRTVHPQWPGTKGKESRNAWPEVIQQLSNWANLKLLILSHLPFSVYHLLVHVDFIPW